MTALDYGVRLGVMKSGLEGALRSFDNVKYEGMWVKGLRDRGRAAYEEAERQLVLVDKADNAGEKHLLDSVYLADGSSSYPMPTWVTLDQHLTASVNQQWSTGAVRALRGVQTLQRAEHVELNQGVSAIRSGVRSTIATALDDVNLQIRSMSNEQIAAQTVTRMRELQDDILYAVDRPARLAIEVDGQVAKMLDSKALNQ
jgi:hypothetical protein